MGAVSNCTHFLLNHRVSWVSSFLLKTFFIFFSKKNQQHTVKRKQTNQTASLVFSQIII